jgi:hypothetical protein
MEWDETRLAPALASAVAGLVRGGRHGDPGGDGPLPVVLREAGEETGLTDLMPWLTVDDAARATLEANLRESLARLHRLVG